MNTMNNAYEETYITRDWGNESRAPVLGADQKFQDLMVDMWWAVENTDMIPIFEDIQGKFEDLVDLCEFSTDSD